MSKRPSSTPIENTNDLKKRKLESSNPQTQALDRTMKKVTFVTGNAGKLREVSAIMNEDSNWIEIDSFDVDLPEYQDTVENISKMKCRMAAEKVGGPVMVEDVGLGFNALNGLPGPYIKWFLKSLGNEGLLKLLAAHEDKTGFAQCTYSFCPGPGVEPITFTGITNGTIVEPRSGDVPSFGWDPIFQPEGFDQTYAEMPMETKNEISHRRKGVEQLRAYLKENDW
eukprot:TRINITY_DN5369_c0_g1_i1.p1 TRINITY_DN5369_c0_g1~~TRINITY_DN5369_c0_g1_i1.p1  ORF type:complete len:260 (-),score=58.97 TRINITY_DN5369_c0_g1_i1:474-1148(-)